MQQTGRNEEEVASRSDQGNCREKAAPCKGPAGRQEFRLRITGLETPAELQQPYSLPFTQTKVIQLSFSATEYYPG